MSNRVCMKYFLECFCEFACRNLGCVRLVHAVAAAACSHGATELQSLWSMYSAESPFGKQERYHFVQFCYRATLVRQPRAFCM